MGDFSPRSCFRGHSCTGLSLPGRREQTGSEDKRDQGWAVTLFPSLFVGCGKPKMVNSAEIAWKNHLYYCHRANFPSPLQGENRQRTPISALIRGCQRLNNSY